MNQPTAAVIGSWNINAGSATVSGLITLAGASNIAGRVSKIVTTTGTLNGNGGITVVAAAVANKVIDMSGGAGTFNLKGALTTPVNGTLTAGTTSTFNYADTATTQAVGFFGAGGYANLNFNNTTASGATLATAITTTNVTGDITVGSGLLSTTVAIAGNAGKTFSVASGATYKTTSTTAPIPTGFGTITFDANSTTKYNQSNLVTVIARSYGHLELNSAAANKTMTIGAGTLSVAGNLSIGGGTLASPVSAATNNPVINLTGNITINALATFTASSTQTLSVAGNWTNDGTFSGNGGLVSLNGTGSQTIAGSTATAFASLTIANTAAAITANTNFSVPTAETLTVNANAVLTPAAAVIIGGAGTLTGSGTVRVTRTAATADFSSQYTITNKTLTNLTVDYMGTAAQTVSAITYGNLSIDNSSGATAAGNLTIGGDLSVSTGTLDLSTFTANRSTSGGTLTVASGATLKIGGANSFPSNYTTHTLGATSTVNYSGTSQTVSAESYGHLTTSGSGTKTAGGAVTVNGNVTVGASTTLDLSSFSHTFKGNLTNSGTFTASTSTVTLSGGSASHTLTATAAIAFNNLIMNDANGARLSGGNVTVNGTLTLTSGNITTSANVLIIGSSGSVSRTSGHIVGNLRKTIASGSNVSTDWEVGNGNYSPATTVFATVSGSGTFTVAVTTSDHPNIGTSGFDTSHTVNKYWTLTQGTMTFSSTYTATFTFVAGDLDSGATTGYLAVGRYNAGWTYPTTGARTSTTTQGTGLSAFGDFQLAQASWDSYNSTCATITASYGASPNNILCGKGTGYGTSGGAYSIGIYDANGAARTTDNSLSASSGTVTTGDYNLTNCCAWGAPGTWHMIIFEAATAPSGDYATVSGASSVRQIATFTVTASALPDLPTPLSALLAALGVGTAYAFARKWALSREATSGC